MDKSINRDAVDYTLRRIFRNLRQRTGKVSPTICEARLHALIYLVDVAYVREHKESLTGVTYHYLMPDKTDPECECDACIQAKEIQPFPVDRNYDLLGGTGDSPFKRMSSPTDGGSNPDVLP